ncbi:hypothetical protein [Deinococcus ruber]|uniref:Uncharacterized protein n=1 Tax=Deinococcus ruber TaxID=1848197 RepID=A0A918BX08_9DEIO|nr:hypothetical protein [Deinococcus ruber]GGQ97017.1 hypothetical protein GCM10008957_06660 [Deinococcus ruber]
MSDETNAVGNVVDAAKNKVNELADRARAAGHEVASQVGNNPLDNAADKAMAAEDHLKADVHHAEANASMGEAKKDVSRDS